MKFRVPETDRVKNTSNRYGTVHNCFSYSIFIKSKIDDTNRCSYQLRMFGAYHSSMLLGPKIIKTLKARKPSKKHYCGSGSTKIRIHLAVLDPGGNADPDPRVWKLAKIYKYTWFTAFQKGFVPFVGRLFDLLLL